MVQLTFDAGVLIAADRNDDTAWLLLTAALVRGQVPVVPAPVLTQAWRGGRNARMAQYVKACHVEEVSEALAKQAGVLCGTTGTADAVDAIVVASAEQRADTVVTSDPDDIGRLSQAVVNVSVRPL